MMQLGIRLHDVNTTLPSEEQTMERRAEKAREEGFSCVHLAFSKVVRGVTFDSSALNEGLAMYIRRVFAQTGLDVAVLGCYLNLAHPDSAQLAEIQSRYFGHIRVAALLGAGVVGTETGAPNPAYKLDAATHTDAALDSFIRGLIPVVECAEHYGVTVAIEPVWNHIVHTPDRAVTVLRSVRSRNLRIILDPVNLLYPGNADDRDRVIAEAIDKLGEYVAVVHIKDFVYTETGLKSVAAGTGGMDYTRLLRFMKERKPYIQATLENTDNTSAVSSREYIQKIYNEL